MTALAPAPPAPPLGTIEALLDFAWSAGPRCFRQWEKLTMEAYLRFHLAQGTLAYVIQEPAARITGLAVGWPLAETAVRQADFVTAPWRYHRAEPAGDSFYVDNLICSAPGAIAELVSEFQWRFPQWRRRKFFAIRRGRLRQYRVEKFLSRLEGSTVGVPRSL